MSNETNTSKQSHQFIPLYGNTKVTFEVKDCEQAYLALAKIPKENNDIIGVKDLGKPFISHLATKSFELNFVSIDCGNTGTWILSPLWFEKPIELVTPQELSYQFFRLNEDRRFHFEVRCSRDVQLALTKTPTIADPIYEIVIGGWRNRRSAIRKNRKKIVASVSTPDIVNENHFIEFWISFKNDTIVVSSREYKRRLFMVHRVDKLPDFLFLGVRTGSHATGTWKLYGFSNKIEQTSVEAPFFLKINSSVGGRIEQQALAFGSRCVIIKLLKSLMQKVTLKRIQRNSIQLNQVKLKLI
uniref:Methyltransf_FA domain-containing protein n=1 Tax=Glossina austeni TaxID=7395 RepID=A0A1A9URN5_GLOAU